MSKIHITLVGGQPAPVYHGIVATKPDYVFYVCSQSRDSRRAQNILKKVLKKMPCGWYSLHPTDPVTIKSFTESLAERFKDDEVTVNISGGLKSWSHWFGIVFDKYPNASVVYMDQNNVLWNYRTMESSSGFEFDMNILFRLYRNPLDNYTPFSVYTKEDFDAIAQIERCRQFNFQDFNKLTTVLPKIVQQKVRNNKEGLQQLLNSSSTVSWKKKQNNGMQLVELCVYNEDAFIKETIQSPHAMELVFFAGWFECKIARLLSAWSHAKEICMNCHFPFKEGVDKNEVDIIINTGTKILFVECKTQIFDTTAIDKFRSVVKGYGGTASKGLFVTDAIMTDIAKAKCKEHGILSFSLQDNHGDMGIEEALSELLDEELYNINAR